MENIELSDSFIIGIGIQRLILNAFGEATALGKDWDLNKFIKEISEDPGVKSEFDIHKLSDGELLGLGFGKIDDNTNVRLIPTWLYQFLPKQLYVYGKNSTEAVIIDKKDLGTPIRGYFGYGILAPNTPLHNDDKVAVTSDDFTENDVKVE